MTVYGIINDIVEAGRSAALVTLVGCGEDRKQDGCKMILCEGQALYSGFDQALTNQIVELAGLSETKHQSRLIELNREGVGNGLLFLHRYNPPPRLIIMGGGHVGAALCQMAAILDYRIVVVDDRPLFASSLRHPAAHELVCEKFESAFDSLVPSPQDYIVIVTRGHQHDRICLEKALNRESAYIGMIGSRSRVKAQLKDLAGSGYSEELLSRLHSPIGLAIGAVTEAEIAVSVLAEITRVRRSNSSDEAVQSEVLFELSRVEQAGSKAVLVTIINSMGSTPRKTGSQMLVYPDGSITGTIGGGCAEAEARREALDCFDCDRNKLLKLELTLDAAAAEGMACGGILELYFERIF